VPEQVVDTFDFEVMPGHVILETMTLEAQADGTTKLTAASVPALYCEAVAPNALNYAAIIRG